MNLNDYDKGLFEELRQLRLRIAREGGVPAYVVFHNSTLQLMAYYIPLNRASLSRMPGVGPVKLEKWGDCFLAVIRNYAFLHGLGERTIPDRKSDIPRASDSEHLKQLKREIPWHRTSSAQDLPILLRKHFDHDEFWWPQKEIILSLLKGQDTLVVMSTGGGKSLCYQLPALMFDGLTLVISPLIALMKDQVDTLQSNGIAAAFLNSTQSSAEGRRVQELARQGFLDILYVSPERLLTPHFLLLLSKLRVSLVAVDEAHCISMWGHEFRPAYRKLGEIRDNLPSVPFVALTATATPQVQRDIVEQLRLNQPQKFITSFNRANLRYSIQAKTLDSSFALLDILQNHRSESTIIYCASRKETERLAGRLCDTGFIARPYHANLAKDVRHQTQELFIRNQVPIIVATIAFGMGIDKPDIRLIVHYDLPKSIEGYYQETGRAGRDGLSSECVLLYARKDRMKHTLHINQMKDQSERRIAQEKLGQVIDFCEHEGCRRRYVLHYLGEQWESGNCAGCDNCLQAQWWLEEAQLLSRRRTTLPWSQTTFGMEGDSATLLGIRDVLAGSGSLNWSEKVSVWEWEGVRVDSSSTAPRVTEIRLGGKGLTGAIPTRLAKLTDLRLLYLKDNELRGEIPVELGKLTNLKWLSLSDNRLTGSIPKELGSLSNWSGFSSKKTSLTAQSHQSWAISKAWNGFFCLTTNCTAQFLLCWAV